jgi:HrpA-like RNA helicase
MSVNAARPDDVVVKEVEGGGYVAELPADIPVPKQETQQNDSDPEGSDEADERARQTEIARVGAVDADAEALREQKRLKRQKRKEYHKQVTNERELELQQLRRENQSMAERLAVVERKTTTSEIARADQAIEEEAHRIVFAKQKIKEAAETGNGELLVSAQDLLMEASKRHDQLNDYRQRMTARPAPQAAVPKIDPMVQRHAAQWLAKNSWYDAGSNDPDCRRALMEDQILAEEGYDPKTREYWEELDNRLQNVMPHRYTDTVSEEQPRYSKPRTVVTGSGRENIPPSSEGKNYVNLSKDEVDAIKEAGMWDDPIKRNRMIARYARERQNIRERG